MIFLFTLLVAVCTFTGDQPNPYGLDHRALPYFRHRYLDFVPRFPVEECVIRIGYESPLQHTPTDDDDFHFFDFYSEIDHFFILDEPKALRVDYVASAQARTQQGEIHVFFADECDRRREISDGIVNTLGSKHPDYTFIVIPEYDASIVKSRTPGNWLNGDDDIVSERRLANRAYGGDPKSLLTLASYMTKEGKPVEDIRTLPLYYQFMTLASCRLTDELIKFKAAQKADGALMTMSQRSFPLYEATRTNTEILIYILERLLPQVWSVRACLGKQRTVP